MGNFLGFFKRSTKSDSSRKQQTPPNTTTSISERARAYLAGGSTDNDTGGGVDDYQAHETTRGPESMKLKVENNFDSYENVLYVNHGPPSSSSVVFGCDNYSLGLFDYSKKSMVKTWKGHEKDVTKTLYCRRIDRYLSASRDKTVRLWSAKSDLPELTMTGHELVVTAIATDSENTHLITGSRDNNLNLYDLKTGKLLSTTHISRNLITDVFWSNDGKLLVQSSEDKEIRLWDPLNLKQLFSFPKKQYIQSSCQLSSDANYAISSSNGFQGNGCEVTIWDLRKRAMLVELAGHSETVTCARYIRNGEFIASCSNDSTVRIWDAKTFKCIDSIYLNGSLSSICESKNYLVASSLQNGIFVVEA